MKRISNNIENTIIIKNSKFITNLFIVENIEEVNKYLNLIKDNIFIISFDSIYNIYYIKSLTY